MPSTHITVEGDTFDSLALTYYDDEKRRASSSRPTLTIAGR